jgi:hypothetical protein
MNPLDELQPKRPQLSISSSKESFSSFIDKDYISHELKEQLRTVNVLIVPNEGYGDLTDQVHFPAGTSDLYQYLLESKDENLSIGVCLEDKDYKELSLHADWLTLAEFVAKDFLAPLLVALLAEYIIHTLGKRVEKTNVKSRLVVVDAKDEHRVEYTYEGPALEYKDVMLNAISKFGKDDQGTKKGASKRRRKKRGHR